MGRNLKRDLLIKGSVIAFCLYLLAVYLPVGTNFIITAGLAFTTAILIYIEGRHLRKLKQWERHDGSVIETLGIKLIDLNRHHLWTAHLLASTPALAVFAYLLLYFFQEYGSFGFFKTGQVFSIPLIIIGSYAIGYFIQRKRYHVYAAGFLTCLRELDEESSQNSEKQQKRLRRAEILVFLAISSIILLGLLIFLLLNP